MRACVHLSGWYFKVPALPVSPCVCPKAMCVWARLACIKSGCACLICQQCSSHYQRSSSCHCLPLLKITSFALWILVQWLLKQSQLLLVSRLSYAQSRSTSLGWYLDILFKKWRRWGREPLGFHPLYLVLDNPLHWIQLSYLKSGLVRHISSLLSCHQGSLHHPSLTYLIRVSLIISVLVHVPPVLVPACRLLRINANTDLLYSQLSSCPSLTFLTLKHPFPHNKWFTDAHIDGLPCVQSFQKPATSVLPFTLNCQNPACSLFMWSQQYAVFLTTSWPWLLIPVPRSLLLRNLKWKTSDCCVVAVWAHTYLNSPTSNCYMSCGYHCYQCAEFSRK